MGSDAWSFGTYSPKYNRRIEDVLLQWTTDLDYDKGLSYDTGAQANFKILLDKFRIK